PGPRVPVLEVELEDGGIGLRGDQLDNLAEQGRPLGGQLTTVGDQAQVARVLAAGFVDPTAAVGRFGQVQVVDDQEIGVTQDGDVDLGSGDVFAVALLDGEQRVLGKLTAPLALVH